MVALYGYGALGLVVWYGQGALGTVVRYGYGGCGDGGAVRGCTGTASRGDGVTVVVMNCMVTGLDHICMFF